MISKVRQLMENVDPMTLAKGMDYCAEHQAWAGRDQRHNIPALLLTGGLDEMSPPHRNEALSRLFPKGQLKILAEAGHMLNLEAARELNHALLNFLKEISLCKTSRFRLAHAV
jgi:pimeloyl-ACP methyl ester carboxylesterase